MLKLSFWRDIERGRLQLESVYVPSPLCVCVCASVWAVQEWASDCISVWLSVRQLEVCLAFRFNRQHLNKQRIYTQTTVCLISSHLLLLKELFTSTVDGLSRHYRACFVGTQSITQPSKDFSADQTPLWKVLCTPPPI